MTRYMMDFAIPNLDKIDDGTIVVPGNWEIKDFISNPRPGVERYWIEDGSAPWNLEGKLVDITITREGIDLDNARDDDQVYISDYKVIES